MLVLIQNLHSMYAIVFLIHILDEYIHTIALVLTKTVLMKPSPMCYQMKWNFVSMRLVRLLKKNFRPYKLLLYYQSSHLLAGLTEMSKFQRDNTQIWSALLPLILPHIQCHGCQRVTPFFLFDIHQLPTWAKLLLKTSTDSQSSLKDSISLETLNGHLRLMH
jgi:hypothetical protein